MRDYVEELLSRKLDIVSKPRKGERHIFLVVSSKVKLPEGYTLFVNKDKITIEGGSCAGVFYGIQTLRKSLVANNALSPVIIHDAPRFSWRGMHLDCSRHFFPVSFVKKYIDLLALHQMNVFHWHLTDDQDGVLRSRNGRNSSRWALIVQERLSVPIPISTMRHHTEAITPKMRLVRLWHTPRSVISPLCRR